MAPRVRNLTLLYVGATARSFEILLYRIWQRPTIRGSRKASSCLANIAIPTCVKKSGNLWKYPLFTLGDFIVHVGLLDLTPLSRSAFAPGKVMPSIHLIERHNNIIQILNSPNEWESGDWVVADKTAALLVGGNIYFHTGQTEASHFGGEILSYRVHCGGTVDGRKVFRFRASQRHKGVVAAREGWGTEKKLVW